MNEVDMLIEKLRACLAEAGADERVRAFNRVTWGYCINCGGTVSPPFHLCYCQCDE